MHSISLSNSAVPLPPSPAPYPWTPQSYWHPYAPGPVPSAYHSPAYPPGQRLQPLTFHNTHPSAYEQQPQSEPTAFRIALGDTTTATVNSPAATPVQAETTGSKRSRKGGRSSANKKRNTGAAPAASSTSNSTPTPLVTAIPGIGPIDPSLAQTGRDTLHPALDRLQNDFGSLLQEESPGSLTNASDIWYFTRGQHTDTDEPIPENSVMSEERPSMDIFNFLRCRLCTKKLTIWKNVEGQNKAIRTHLRKHGKHWLDLVVSKKLKGWKTIRLRSKNSSSEEHPREPFTLEGFLDRLVRWVTVDDQSLDVVDCHELRDLLLFLSIDLDDSDIPHRTKLGELIAENFKKEYMKMVGEISNSLGRVAFTSDIWSRQNLQSYMAVTAHYLVKSTSGQLTLRSRLVAFRHIQGSHSGANIGRVFVNILKEINCLHKVSTVTLDNASNNNTSMEEICDELRALGIPFDVTGNRIRCFPHIINLAVKAGLGLLTQLGLFDEELDTAFGALAQNPTYAGLLQSDVVKLARQLVNFIRDSGQRREDFENVIRSGNESKSWGNSEDEQPILLRVVGLLRDVDTRWSSTFLMIDRVLEMRPAIQKFFRLEKYEDYADAYLLSEDQFAVLNDVRRFLHLFHVVQEVVSAEKTPTLSVILPMYEKLLTMLESLKSQLPELSVAITASQTKLREYLMLSRKTKAYAAAMVINPTMKFEWLQSQWSSDEYTTARKSIFDALLQYRTALRQEGRIPTVPSAPLPPSRRLAKMPSASSAARAQTSGLARFSSLARSLSSPAVSGDSSNVTAGNEAQTPAESPEELERRLQEEDKKAVEDEIAKWEKDGVIRDDDLEMEDFDLLRFWQSNQTVYPLFWRLATDTLPMQASAVPCERAFSSSKETDALRRSSLSPLMMEMLQVLKFIYRGDRLSFTENLLSSEFELSILDIEPQVIDRLMAEGRIDELCELVDESWRGWGNSEEIDCD